MARSSFDSIAQEVIKQQHLMQQMQIENRELRRQIADLKAGRGLFIEIGGQQFTPREEQDTIPSTRVTVPEAQNVAVPSSVTTTSNVEISEPPQPQKEEGTPHQEKDEKPTTPTFLEEIMIDEFAIASTSPTAIWSAPIEKQKATEEEQMAALRRELMGSFLLE